MPGRLSILYQPVDVDQLYETLEHDAICLHYLSTEHIARTVEYIHELSGDRFMILAHGDGTLAIPDGDGLYELSYALFEEPEETHRKCRKMADDAIARNAAYRPVEREAYEHACNLFREGK